MAERELTDDEIQQLQQSGGYHLAIGPQTLTDNPAVADPDALARLNAALVPAAHPQTLGDVADLLFEPGMLANMHGWEQGAQALSNAVRLPQVATAVTTALAPAKTYLADLFRGAVNAVSPVVTAGPGPLARMATSVSPGEVADITGLLEGGVPHDQALEAVLANRAASVPLVAQTGTPAPATGTTSVPQLTNAELTAAQGLIQRGMSADQALRTLLAQRSLPTSPQMPPSVFALSQLFGR